MRRTLLTLVLLVGVLFGSTGCLTPDAALIRACDRVISGPLTSYATYVASDDRLTSDQKRMRLQGISSFDAAVQEAKK